MKIDLTNKQTLVSYKEVDICMATVRAIVCSKTSDLDMMKFRNECISFMKGAAAKLIKCSPLKYSIVRSVTSLAPRNILLQCSTSERRMGELLQKLYESNRISALVAVRAKVQFASLCSLAEGDQKALFDGYSISQESLDCFYAKLLAELN